MQRASELSLVAALFGWPHADGFDSPDQQAPDSWRRDFLAMADAGVWLGLFRSCRSGRDLALSTAPRARLLLNTSKPHAAATWLQRLSSSKLCLSVRGDLPTQFWVSCGHSPESAQACSFLPAILYGPDSLITHLMLREETESEQQPCVAYTSALLGAVSAPRLQTLDLERPAALPPAAYLPALRKLTIDFTIDHPYWDQETVDSALISIAPFSTQLTSLSLLDGGSNVDFAWPLAFLPQTPSHTLTHFNTNYYLEPPLLTALLDHAPALTHLSVSNIDLESQSFAHRQWCVECISTGGVDESIRDIVLLPVRASGRIRIETDEWEQELSVSSAQGLDAELAARLSEFSLGIGCLKVQPADSLPEPDHATALRNTLTQLSQLQLFHTDRPDMDKWEYSSPSLIELSGWQLSQQCAQALADLLPTGLAHLSVGVHTDTELTDELLGVVLAMGPHMKHLEVKGLALQSDTHGSTHWPWERLNVHTLDVSQLCRLPNPAGPGAPRVLACSSLIIYSGILQVDESPRLHQRLAHLQLRSNWGVVKLPCPDTKPLDTLTAQLALLRATSFKETDKVLLSVRLEGWSVTHDIMCALAGLPEWPCFIGFFTCTWPLEPSEYFDLPQHVPLTYCRWGLDRAPTPVMESICDGMRERREGLDLPTVHVHWDAKGRGMDSGSTEI